MSTPTVAVLHPGWMGAAVAAAARARGADVIWHPTGRSARTHDRAQRAGLHPVPDLDELVAAADIIVSVCPPAAAGQVAQAVATAATRIRFRGVYVEANAISPTRATAIADILAAAEIPMVDAAIIGPPPAGNISARLYLSGSPGHTTCVADLFTGTPVHPVILGDRLGSASALKMAQAHYQKASRALAAVSHALAARHDVTEHLLAEAARNARSPLSDPGYLPTVAARAWRWAPELLDVADTLHEAGLPDDLACAASAVLDHWTNDKDIFDLPLPTILTQLTQTPPTASPRDGDLEPR